MDNVLSILTFASFVASVISAVSGAAGGAILLAVMQCFFAPLAVLPLHSVVQLASNGLRALLSPRAANWRVVGQFIVGGLAGTYMGSLVLEWIPVDTIPTLIGIMILGTTLAPRRAGGSFLPGRFVAFGVIQGTAGMVTGAAGPLVTSALQREGAPRDTIVVTTAVMMTCLSAMRTFVFFRSGVSMSDYGALFPAMVAASLAGTWLGTAIRGRIPEAAFQTQLKIILVAVGVLMLCR